MYIEEISILNYKNLKEVKIDLSPHFNCIIGKNGAGKTNLLDAIYYLSFCKSFLTVDQFNIHHDESYCMISGNYVRLGLKEVISCGLRHGQKKQFRRNSKLYKKLMEHIGLIPLVMITPSDDNLILSGSNERRKFMDGVISQYNHGYLDNLLKYNRALLQRNNLLKQFVNEDFFDKELLTIWDEQLIKYGTEIHKERSSFVSRLIPLFQDFYEAITGGIEQVGLVHQSELYERSMDQLLTENIGKDRRFLHTTSGVHKDDLLFTIDGYPVKRLGSQGQKKSYLVALKLSQFQFIKDISDIKPILLLDDIFDKLDRQRVEQIVKIVTGSKFGQVFISDTNREHLDSIIRDNRADYKIFFVDDGVIETIE